MQSGIISTTLVSNNAPLIADALRSVREHVDACLIIDTGSSDKTLEVAQRVAGEKFVLRQFSWAEDFAAARNFALRCAAELAFDWALTLDSDERILFSEDAATFRQQISEERTTQLFLARDSVYGYHKERLIALPSSYLWQGRTHEYFAGLPGEKRGILHNVSFYELPKSKLDMSIKLARDLRLLQEEIAASPRTARWWYFLGQTLERLDLTEEAVDAYQNNVRLSEWDEEVAWSQFCIARCQIRRAQHLEALTTCARGLGDYRSSPELAWLAGKCALELAKYGDAIEWAELAIALGSCAEVNRARINFRHLPAWFEAPYTVLRMALEKINQLQAATEAMRKFAEALRARKTAMYRDEATAD
jgi:tetratricopeptide (TPR) repeat protein